LEILDKMALLDLLDLQAQEVTLARRVQKVP